MSSSTAPFDLIETIAFDPEEGLIDLDAHVHRLGGSADALGFALDRHGVRNELHAATFRLMIPSMVRLRLSRSGAVAIESRAKPGFPARPTVALRPLPVPPDDLRLRHKTSDRGFYDRARIEAGTVEVLFVHPAGLLTEGSFTNLFVTRADGMLVTPALALGLLPGVLRGRLIDEGKAIEGEVRPEDLADGFLIGNALRGLIAAELTTADA